VFYISVFDDITLHSASTVASIDAKNTEFAFYIHAFQTLLLTFSLFPAGSGWDIYRSDDVTITNSQITNQDDCVSFKPNSTNVLVQNLICNGSHGISVGFILCYCYPRVELKLTSDRSAVLVNVCCSPSLWL
jgi:Glycosyl hydrolases family 28